MSPLDWFIHTRRPREHQRGGVATYDINHNNLKMDLELALQLHIHVAIAS